MIPLTILSDSMLMRPDRLVQPIGWIGHIPFMGWLIATIKPSVFVELGTHSGNSYLAACQAVLENRLNTKCYAVDTWQGDMHSGSYGEDIFLSLSKYHDKKYTSFSNLLRMSFDQAVNYFSDQSVDLLHIDGLHTYDAVKHDFEIWLPKLSNNGIVIFHDINVRDREFGVWKLWEQLQTLYPSIEFYHSNGLGVLFVGKSQPDTIQHLVSCWREPNENLTIQKLFARLGEHIVTQFETSELSQEILSFNKEVVSLQNRLMQDTLTSNHREQSLYRIIDELHTTINNLIHSTSWRITAPLRFLAQIIRGQHREAWNGLRITKPVRTIRAFLKKLLLSNTGQTKK